MPGGSRGELQGVVSGPPEAPIFDGSLSLRGTSVVRFFGWATGNALTFDAKGDGAFGVRSQISIAAGSVAARNVVGDLSGTTVRGDARYRWEGRPELSLLLESPQLDARAFIPAGSSLGDIFNVVLHGPAARQAPQDGDPGSAKPGWRGDPDGCPHPRQRRAAHHGLAHLSRRDAGDGAQGRTLEVAAAARCERRRLQPGARGRGGECRDAAEGDAARGDRAPIPRRPSPPWRTCSAFPKHSAPTQDARRPWRRCAWPDRCRSVRAHRPPPMSSLDGELNGAGVKLNARLDGGAGRLAHWARRSHGPGRRRRWRAHSGLAGAGQVRRQPAAILSRDGCSSRPAACLPRGSRRWLRWMPAVWRSASGGKWSPRRAATRLTGELEIKAVDGARIAALAGLTPPLRLDGLPVAGTLKFAADGSRLTIDRLALNLAGSEVTGQVSIASAGDRRRVAGASRCRRAYRCQTAEPRCSTSGWR